MATPLDALLFPVRRSFEHCHAVMDHQLRKSFKLDRHPRVSFELKRGRYLLKTASCAREVEEILKLRYQVFHSEYGSPGSLFRLDADYYDLNCDYVIVWDAEARKLAGVYRIVCGQSGRFYSDEEFVLDEFLRLPHSKLEIGRACIASEYRRGVVIRLLWEGVLHYLSKTDARYVFGCSSMKVESSAELRQICDHLRERGILESHFDIRPRAAFVPGQFGSDRAPLASFELPALLNSYLKLGAKIWGEPALDREFNCVDFFTVLDMAEASKVLERFL